MDKNITCRDCGSTFTFTEAEQAFYAEKGFKNDPARCPECRGKKKAQRNNNRGMGGSSDRKMYDVTCDECGADTKVPFQPSGDRPIYCKDCFEAKRR